MTFNYGEYGSILYINLGVDITAATSLTVVMEPERGEAKTFTSNIAVGTANTDVDDKTYLAGEFMEYTLQDGDLDYVGQWRVRGSALVGTELVKSDYERITVLP